MKSTHFFITLVAFLFAASGRADWQKLSESTSQGLVLHLPLDEGKGEFAVDRVSGRTMQIVNGEWAERPRSEGGFSRDDKSYETAIPCIRFNGQDSSVEVDGFAFAGEEARFSVGAWIKPDSVNPKSIEQCGYIVSQNSGNYSGFNLTTYYNAGLCAMVVTNEGSFTATADHVLRAGEWQHVGVSWDGEVLQLYVDGVPVGTAAVTTGVFIPFKGPLRIGKAADRDGQGFTGEISDVRIREAALTLARVDGLGDPQPRPAEADLKDYGNRQSRHVIGRTRPQAPLIDFSKDLTGWKCTSYSGISEGVITSSGQQQLWGGSSAKITLRGGKFADKQLKKLVLTPPMPIPITEAFDSAEIWIYSSYWGEPKGVKISLQIRGPDGIVNDVRMESLEHPFAFWSGWFLWRRNLSEAIDAPAELVSLTVSDFDGKKEESIFIDSVMISRRPKDALKGEVPEWTDCDFPNTADTILPDLPEKILFKNSIQKNGKAYRLVYEGSDGRIEYSFEPRTGTLADLKLLRPGRSYELGHGGGWLLEADGETHEPDSTAVTAALESCALEDGVVKTRWKISAGGTSIASHMNVSIRQKSLVIEMAAEGGAVKEFVCGRITGADKPILTRVPYLVLRGGLHESQDPAIFFDNGIFISSFLDWYASRASELFGKAGIVSDGRGPAVAVNGGSAYYPTTAGIRNPAHERLFITASEKFDEVLPNIPNPPNRWLETTKTAVWATRMWYVNSLPHPTYYDEEFEFWKKLRAFGVTNIFLRQHVTVYRQYADNKGDPYTLVTDTEPGLGGDAKLAGFFSGMQDQLGYRCALYTNYTLVDPLSVDVWNEDLVALLPDGDWRYGSINAVLLKPSRVLPLQRIYNPELKRKFNPTASYLDQFTCRPLWGHTDYDSRVAEAGQFSPVLRVFGNALRAESAQFDGPVLSEGICQWMLSGLCDSYAQPGDPAEDALLNFQLGKMHLLSNDCGYHLQVVASENQADVDNLLSAEIAYGNIGVIFGAYGGPPPKEVSAATLKSYFMIQQLQQHYANVPVSEIRYQVNGKLDPIEKAIPAQALKNNQVYVKYQNGLEVFVNRNPSATWTVGHRGRSYVLPPYGYLCSLPGAIHEYSVLQDGRRIDYVKGSEYLYCSGGGKETDFGALKAAHAYSIRWQKNGLCVTPAPFVGEERIVLRTSELPSGLAGKMVSVTPVGQDGTRGVSTKVEVPSGGGEIPVDVRDGVQSYLVSLFETPES